VQATNALAAGAGMAQTMGSTIYVSMKAIYISQEEPFYPFVVINLIGLLVFLLLLTPPSTEKEDAKINEMWPTEQELEITPLILGKGGKEVTEVEPKSDDRCSDPKSSQYRQQRPKCSGILCSTCQKENRLKSTPIANYFSISSDWSEAILQLSDIFVFLVMFYFLEYYTNLGLLEHATVRKSQLNTSQQYRWLMFSYHLTQTVIRAIPLPRFMEQLLAPLTIGQVIVTALIFTQALFDYMSHFWILVVLIVAEGCLGSVTYMIALRKARNCSEKDGVKKAATILVLAADILALGLGSLCAVSTHEILCRQRAKVTFKNMHHHVHH